MSLGHLKEVEKYFGLWTFENKKSNIETQPDVW